MVKQRDRKPDCGHRNADYKNPVLNVSRARLEERAQYRQQHRVRARDDDQRDKRHNDVTKECSPAFAAFELFGGLPTKQPEQQQRATITHELNQRRSSEFRRAKRGLLEQRERSNRPTHDERNADHENVSAYPCPIASYHSVSFGKAVTT